MTAISRKRLEYACQVFLAQMGRSYAAENPESETPIKTLTDYSPEQRSILMKAVLQAIKSTHENADKGFENWLSQQSASQ